MNKSKIISGAVATFLAAVYFISMATSAQNTAQDLITDKEDESASTVSTTSDETVSKSLHDLSDEQNGEPKNIENMPREATIEGASQDDLITVLPDASTYTVAPVAAGSKMSPPVISEILPPLKKGWNDQLSVWNNLKKSASYGRVVTDDAYTIVCRNVEAEMSGESNIEALKAQAITAYSFIKYQKRPPSLPLSDYVSDNVKYAVSCVSGYAVMYNGYYAQTVYGASSSGVTASAQEIWGAYIPYLISLPCQVDAVYNKEDYGNVTYYKSSEIAKYVKDYTGISLSGDPNTWFNLIRSPAGYVSYVGIGGKGYVTGENFRMRVMNYQIKSENLYINYDAKTDTFIMTTFGFGHGVGMSQTAAHYLGKYYGWNWQQIVHYFYPGVTIQKVVDDSDTNTKAVSETDVQSKPIQQDTATDIPNTDSETATETDSDSQADTQADSDTATDSEIADTDSETNTIQ